MAETLNGSMFVYPWDLEDEGVDLALDTIHERGGIREINVAMAYHSGLFLLPHNPKRKIMFADPSIYFLPESSFYSELYMKPIVSQIVIPDFLPRLRKATSKRGMRMAAWIVCLHSSALGAEYPESTTENAFGDRHRFRLCPANPNVCQYHAALVKDVACHGFESIILESLEYMPTLHSYHHEKRGIETTPFVEFLLDLCFCPNCQQFLTDEGLDPDDLRFWVIGLLERFFAGDFETGRPNAGWNEILSYRDGILAIVQHCRKRAVTSFCRELRSALPVESGVRLEATDFGPLWKLGAHEGVWETGFDTQSAFHFLDALMPTPYFASIEQVRETMASYHRMLPSDTRVKPCLRAIWPEVTGSEDLLAKMNACDSAKVDGFSFYNYGLMPLRNLDWIKEAMGAFKSQRDSNHRDIKSD